MSVTKPTVKRTPIRTEKTMTAYLHYLEARAKEKHPKNPFASIEDEALITFKHWLIIPNRFPYDAIAVTSHLLFTRRRVAFDWDLLNEDELQELHELKKGYIREHYDLIWENMPKAQSVPGHFHLHLLVLKRWE